jgi:hypothetical protein
LEVEKMESLLSKVTVCMPKVAAIVAMGETGEGGIGGEDCFHG